MVFVVSTSALDCLERLVSKMTCYVLNGVLNPTQSLSLSCHDVMASNDTNIVCCLFQGLR